MANEFADRESAIDISFGEPLPPVCLGCGKPATDTKTIEFQHPVSFGGLMTRVARCFRGFWFIPEEAEPTYLLRLPLCEFHRSQSGELEFLNIRPHRVRTVIVSPVAHEFVTALRALRQSRAAEIHAQMTANEPQDPREFLKSLGK